MTSGQSWARILAITFLATSLMSTSTSLAEDFACGPRCLLQILDHYGCAENEELFELVDEVMPHDRDLGTSLADIKIALSRRDIHSEAVEAGYNMRFRSVEPGIALLSSKGNTLGHYVVITNFDPNSDTIDVWDGLGESSTMQYSDFASVCTGIYLVTSRNPIPRPLDLFESHGYDVSLIETSSVVAIICLFAIRRSSRVSVPS
jgi:hypothetical protein